MIRKRKVTAAQAVGGSSSIVTEFTVTVMSGIVTFMAEVLTTDTPEFTVDELAREAQLPVRTIREYQTLRLLPAPRRRGRVGVYGPDHAQRLAVIARLQRRGYSLAAIRDLLEARDNGTGLAALLGVDAGPAALDEPPLRLTRAQLRDRLPELTTAELRHARAVGLVVPDGRQHVIVRSPALLALVADGVSAGIGVADMLDLVGVLRHGLAALADSVAGQLAAHVLEPLDRQGRLAESGPMLRRGRLLLLQGAASTLADRLGEALLARADQDPAGGGALRAALEEVRIGAVADADGRISRWRPA
jgi:DNA-binding transcriptional MerR regulator